MGSSQVASRSLYSVLSSAVSQGGAETLKSLNLPALVGLPIEQVFLGLSDLICPEGGSIDEGIARDAFIETIEDLGDAGVTDFDGLTADQMQTVFELYVTHTIEARICNDIGNKALSLPADPRAAERVQKELHDFIRRGVADAFAGRAPNAALTSQQIEQFARQAYEDAFAALQSLGEAEAAAE